MCEVLEKHLFMMNNFVVIVQEITVVVFCITKRVHSFGSDAGLVHLRREGPVFCPCEPYNELSISP